MPNNVKQFLPLKECANESGIALYWWREMAKTGRVPCIKSGVKYYVDYPAAINKIRNGDLS